MVVDTEAHVLYRVWPIEADPGGDLIERYRWHEHSGDLLVAEMDRAGVDKAFLIGYDGYDFGYFMERLGGGPDDFWGGRTYARHFVAKHPDRLLFVTTLRDPRTVGVREQLEAEFGQGVLGIKVFPSYLGLNVSDPGLVEAYRHCAEASRLVIFGLEDTAAPRTPTLETLLDEIGKVCTELPDLRVQINHGACVEFDTEDAAALFRLVQAHDGVFVSTSALSGTSMEWRHGWRYPFDSYLASLERLAAEVPREQLVWGSDWPWFEHYALYPQLVDAVRNHATFMDDEARSLYLGGNAERLIGELGSL